MKCEYGVACIIAACRLHSARRDGEYGVCIHASEAVARVGTLARRAMGLIEAMEMDAECRKYTPIVCPHRVVFHAGIYVLFQ
jgi:hypothetical protein